MDQEEEESQPKVETNITFIIEKDILRQTRSTWSHPNWAVENSIPLFLSDMFPTLLDLGFDEVDSSIIKRVLKEPKFSP